jgi:NAD(P)-dependent dehydrogenase (short-subunit alcohol dehydrogenase family)
MDFTGQTAIVTGGANGIGRGCCIKLALLGANTIVADIDLDNAKETARLIKRAGGRAEPYQVDLRRVENIRAMVKFAADTFGGVQILVNNAGLLHATDIEDITEEEWDRICDVNLKGVFFTCQAAIPYFKENGWGKIVNMSSLAGRNGGFANGIAYSATKAGVIGLSKGLATRLAKFSINVNAICPGTTRTNILSSFSEEKIQELETKIPIGRLGSIDDVANAVCFLCSSEASFITGVTLDVNGGMYIG